MTLLIPDIIKIADEFISMSNLPPNSPIWHDSFNEQWYTNRLRWLLNPKGNHGLGVNFAKKFVEKVLEYSNKEPSSSVAGITLRNAIVFPELTISGNQLDIVLENDDPKIVVVIENKVFTKNTQNQLEDYFTTINNKFENYSIKRFVYLTLNGSPPVLFSSEKGILKYWVRMSWEKDILGILKSLPNMPNNPDIENMRNILEWYEKVEKLDSKDISNFRSEFLMAIRDCFLEGLDKFKKDGTTKWEVSRMHKRSATFGFSAMKTFKIVVWIDQNMKLCFHASRGNNKQLLTIQHVGQKPEKLYKELEEVARQTYKLFLPNQMNKKFIEPIADGFRRQECRPFFDFVCKYDELLKSIFLYNSVYYPKDAKV